MIKVYVAGAYSGPNVLTVFDNMRRGIKLASEVFAIGYSPFTPWCDWPIHMQAHIDLETCYNASMAWLEVSDAVLVVAHSSSFSSKGTQAEIARAKELGIPVFYSLIELEEWADAN